MFGAFELFFVIFRSKTANAGINMIKTSFLARVFFCSTKTNQYLNHRYIFTIGRLVYLVNQSNL